MPLCQHVGTTFMSLVQKEEQERLFIRSTLYNQDEQQLSNSLNHTHGISNNCATDIVHYTMNVYFSLHKPLLWTKNVFLHSYVLQRMQHKKLLATNWVAVM